MSEDKDLRMDVSDLLRDLLEVQNQAKQLREAVQLYVKLQKRLGLPDNIDEAIVKIQEMINFLKEWNVKMQKAKSELGEEAGQTPVR